MNASEKKAEIVRYVRARKGCRGTEFRELVEAFPSTFSSWHEFNKLIYELVQNRELIEVGCGKDLREWEYSFDDDESVSHSFFLPGERESFTSG